MYFNDVGAFTSAAAPDLDVIDALGGAQVDRPPISVVRAWCDLANRCRARAAVAVDGLRRLARAVGGRLPGRLAHNAVHQWRRVVSCNESR